MKDDVDLFGKDITCTLGDVEKLVAAQKMRGLTSNAKISLTYMIQVLYPNVTKNIGKNIRDLYEEGFIEGYNLGVKNNENSKEA